MTDIDTLSHLIHSQIEEGRERRAADEQWRAKFENRFRTVTERLEQLTAKQVEQESKHNVLDASLRLVDGTARTAMRSAHDLDEKVFVAIGQLTSKIQDQDSEIEAIKVLNINQSKTLTTISNTLLQFNTVIALTKWAIPGVAVFVTALWALFTHLNH
jgi:hypothetical protein